MASERKARRVIWATLIAVTIGLGVVMGSNVALNIDQSPWGFWGYFYGAFATPIAFGLSLAVLASGSTRARRWGRIIAALTFGLFGSLFANWLAMWRVDPLTLEGAWMYPLAIGALALAWLIWPSRRRATRKATEPFPGNWP